MEPYTIALLTLAIATMAICIGVDRRLGMAAVGVGGGFCLIIVAQLVLNWNLSMLALLSAGVDVLALIWIGRAVVGRSWPSGVHVAGMVMCLSLASHPFYYWFSGAPGVTLAYYIGANTCMAVACLGLLGSAWAELVGRYGAANRLPRAPSGATGWGAGLAARRKAR